MVILVGCSAAFFCSCRKGSGMSYVPEVLTEEQFSGAGYAQGFDLQEGKLVFTVSSQSASTVSLTVRGRGEAEADIDVNGERASVVFDDGEKWQEVTVSVHLQPGENTITLKQSNSGSSPLMVDYIEFQNE